MHSMHAATTDDAHAFGSLETGHAPVYSEICVQKKTSLLMQFSPRSERMEFSSKNFGFEKKKKPIHLNRLYTSIYWQILQSPRSPVENFWAPRRRRWRNLVLRNHTASTMAHKSNPYKKSRAKFRWKWKKKRTRRLQRKRRQMRQRSK
jgi:large subunit ribosomal protein L41e